MSNVIAISGSSGVGKTTISNIISLILGPQKSCQISGDDLHLWERGNENWKKITHLNPQANDLDLGKLHVVSLKEGKTINRRIYDHDTGKFSKHRSIESKEWIIYEGLHALYGEVAEVADVRIFVETSDDLKADWKIRRDINKRGYTKQQVIDVIAARKQDENSYIQPQKNSANVVVNFNKSNDSVEMSYVCYDKKSEFMMSQIKNFYDSMNGFVNLCKKLSLEPSLVQGKGGNVSTKIHDMIIVTSSGQNMADVTWEDGFCVCDMNSHLHFEDEDSFLRVNRASKLSGHGHPSMELSLHRKAPQKYVAHTHPVHLNSVLCSSESKEILKSIFPNLEYDYVEYVSPGMHLYQKFDATTCRIVFLENHGLVVSGHNENEVFDITLGIDNACKEWILKNSRTHVGTKVNDTGRHLFPDSVVFSKEILYITDQILHNIHASGLTPKFLTEDQSFYISEMKAEKDRNESHHTNGRNR